MLKDILERAGSIGYTINIPACVENVLVDLVGPQVSGPVSRGNLQQKEELLSIPKWHTVTKVDFSSKKAQNLSTRFSKFLDPKSSTHYVGSYSMKKS